MRDPVAQLRRCGYIRVGIVVPSFETFSNGYGGPQVAILAGHYVPAVSVGGHSEAMAFLVARRTFFDSWNLIASNQSKPPPSMLFRLLSYGFHQPRIKADRPYLWGH